MQYIDIVNSVLRESNEIPLDVGSFTKSRGVQSAVKDFVNRAYFDLLNESVEWPWMIKGEEISGLQKDTVGELAQWVVSGVFSNNIDWDTFVYTDDLTSTSNRLIYIDWDTWNTKYRILDSQDTDGAVPRFIVQGADSLTYGLSPKPKGAGNVIYRAFNTPTLLVNPTDVIIIPDQYFNVLVTKGTEYLWRFKANIQQAAMVKATYDKSVRRMMSDVSDKRPTIRMRL